jgi:hypothetical protein
MRKTPKNKKPVPIGEVLKEVMGVLKNAKSNEDETKAVFKEIVPQKLIAHLSLQGVVREKLVIHVDAPAWLYEANKYKRKILREIQQKPWGARIKEIHLRIGKVK